ncbi:MAG: hypothetical protein WCF84_22685 [Anaerolineae bacterium]
MATEKYESRLHQGYAELLEEASRFYMTQGNVYDTLRRLVWRLEQEKIPYALIGGMALAAHGFVRMTQDVDLLMTAEGLAAFRERCAGRGYVPAFPGALKTFRDTETHVRIEVITTGEYPGDGKPKAVSFPEPMQASFEQEGIRVITIDKLVELKLASGISAPHRLRDLADVQDLITALELPLAFAERLDPSVRDRFRELWNAARTPDESSG